VERGFAEAAAESGFVETLKFDEIDGIHAFARMERRLGCGRRGAIPGVGFLAGVAAEKAIADFRFQVVGDVAAMFDRQVTDASAGVERAGRNERAGGAGIEAGAAVAAGIVL
jgi:hypothetical protein